MATRFVKWTHDLAPAARGRRGAAVRLVSREGQFLVSARTAFEPPTDVYETESAVIVRLEVAGLKEAMSSIDMEIHDNLLTVSGERPDPAVGTGRRYERMEIETGRFEKSVRIPCPVSETEADARYDDGFLVICLPKRDPVRSTVRLVRID